MNKPKLLIVDDDESIRSQMRWALSRDYDILEAGDRVSAVEFIRTAHPPVVMLDLGLPPMPRDAEEGLKTLEEILSLDPNIKVIIISGNTERVNALKAVEMGAFDFFTKPPVIDEVRVVVKRALRMAELEMENLTLRRQTKPEGLEGILGNSPAMEQVFQVIRKVATVDVPVLILGESGTGKEVTARAIYRLSQRREAAFVVINCGAIPETLLESELFGHEKGTFTGADSRRKGKIEYAEGGTLFLDEIGELSLPLQVKLLRFLQDHIIERVGGREEISVNVRVMAATNRDMKEAVDDGKFREDLYFRLNVVSVFMPPLRDRGDDLLLLARAFLNRYSMEFKKDVRGFNDEAIKALSDYNWPGNVRELENRVKRAVVMSDGELLSSQDLGFLPASEEREQFPSIQKAREALEKRLISEALLRHGNHITHAAKELGISRQTLADMIKKYGISIK
ncbi:MAG: PEP-CTERM-box response regulator transcription factor [Nitrospirae bacterium]|nr:PEP-CTERM-box response regulator transcription factor [Nitrospirota bacterium]